MLEWGGEDVEGLEGVEFLALVEWEFFAFFLEGIDGLLAVVLRLVFFDVDGALVFASFSVLEVI